MMFLYHTQLSTQRLIDAILHIRYRYFHYPHKKNNYLLYNLYVLRLLTKEFYLLYNYFFQILINDIFNYSEINRT